MNLFEEDTGTEESEAEEINTEIPETDEDPVIPVGMFQDYLNNVEKRKRDFGIVLRYLNEQKKLIKETNEIKFEAWLLSDDSDEAKNEFSEFTNPDFKKERLRDYYFVKVFPFLR